MGNPAYIFDRNGVLVNNCRYHVLAGASGGCALPWEPFGSVTFSRVARKQSRNGRSK